MAVTFNQVPANALVPFTYVEIDPSRAGSDGVAFRSLMIGQRLASGTVAAGVPTPVGSAVDARSKFGAGSMLAIMIAAFRRQNPTGQLWGVALDDAAGATDQTHTITVSLRLRRARARSRSTSRGAVSRSRSRAPWLSMRLRPRSTRPSSTQVAGRLACCRLRPLSRRRWSRSRRATAAHPVTSDVRHSYQTGRFLTDRVSASRLRQARRARPTLTLPTRSTSSRMSCST